MDDRATLFDIRGKLLVGALTYDQAKADAAPALESLNAKAKEIAKKHGKRLRPFTFSQFMR